jgi:uncharacterized protein DUF3471
MEIVNAAGNSLLDRLLGLEKKDWNDFFREEHRKTKAARKERLPKRVPGTKPKRELEAYAGTYHEPAYGTVTIRCEGETLHLKWSSFAFPLKPFHYETFVPQLKDEERLPETLREATVRFEMEVNPDIKYLHFLGRTFVRTKQSRNAP